MPATGSGIDGQLMLGEEVQTSPAISGIAGVSGTTNLITFASPHGLVPGDMITLAGFTPSGYNASWPIVSTPSSTTANIPAGLAVASVVGTYVATTWGRAVTPNRTYRATSFKPKHEISRVTSDSIRSAVEVLHPDDWAPGAQTVGYDVDVACSTKNMGLLFKHALGTCVTTGSNPYTHTCTPTGLRGRGLTTQGGLPGTLGVTHPVTIAGGRIESWEVSAEAGSEDPVMLTLGFVGKSVTTATALATPSYTSSDLLYSWAHGSVTLNGVASTCVRGIKFGGKNPARTDAYCLGQDTIDEPLSNARRELGGTLTVDFRDLTLYALYAAGTEFALIVAFTRGSDILRTTMQIRLDGGLPELDKLEVLTQDLPFVCTGATNAAAMTVEVINSQSTP